MTRITTPVAMKAESPAAVRDPAEVEQHVSLSPEARTLLASASSSAEAISHLLRDNLDVDGVQALAYLMPIRKAVWWAAQCTWHGQDGKLPPLQDRALEGTVHWIVEPTRHHQAMATEIADKSSFDNPAGCCVKAASLAGAVADEVFHPDQPLLAARMTTAAVFLACGQRMRIEPQAGYRRFLLLGLEIAADKIPWHR